MMRNCPQPRSLESWKKPSQEIIHTGNGNNDRGSPQVGRGGNKRGRGGSGNGKNGRGTLQLGTKVSCFNNRVQCYVFSGKNGAEKYDGVIKGTILGCDQTTNILFNLCSTYSYVVVRFAFYFEMWFDILDYPIRVSTPIGESIIVTHVYCAWSILCMGFHTRTHLVILDMEYFDIILGMTW